jgi:hypothetical protein
MFSTPLSGGCGNRGTERPRRHPARRGRRPRARPSSASRSTGAAIKTLAGVPLDGGGDHGVDRPRRRIARRGRRPPTKSNGGGRVAVGDDELGRISVGGGGSWPRRRRGRFWRRMHFREKEERIMKR